MSTHERQAAGRALRDTLGAFPTGVAVITTTAVPEGRAIGVTINSFASVSLDPPLALWSLSRRSPSLAHFGAGRRHVIHVLAEAQLALARQFANPRAEKFAGVDWRVDALTGAPAIEGCVARLFCETASLAEGGDHLVIIARVLHHELSARAPLVFYRGSYRGGLDEPSTIGA